MKLPTFTFLFGAVQAVSFSAWGGLSCRGADVVSSKGTQPYTCYYIGSSASIIAMGLSETGNDYYQVYSDTRCKQQTGIVKYNKLCNNFNFLSVSLTVPSLGASTSSEQMGPPDDPLERELQEVLLKRDGLLADNETLSAWWPNMDVTNTRSKRNPGDRYERLGVTAIDETDDNEFNTATFSFTASQRTTWAATVIRRFRNEQANTPSFREYNGAQTIQGRSIQVTLTPNSGNLDNVSQDYLMRALTIFDTRRTDDGHNVWQFYQNGLQYFTLTFKALRG